MCVWGGTTILNAFAGSRVLGIQNSAQHKIATH